LSSFLRRREKFFNSEAGHRSSTPKPVTRLDLAAPAVAKESPASRGFFMKQFMLHMQLV
jgi:hypothetical protein